ncbi:hypothetical protein VNO78_16670 [Psophocarpus tetragonolobus]|uniref:Uncharacterized protein n=1 Tax=Psophocarpus tetragonolobus TaxID=3891 RepID=A0AAN9SML1_PSOTE
MYPQSSGAVENTVFTGHRALQQPYAKLDSTLFEPSNSPLQIEYSSTEITVFIVTGTVHVLATDETPSAIKNCDCDERFAVAEPATFCKSSVQHA